MMNSRKILSAFFAAAFSLGVFAQESDPVLMTVNGEKVLRSEFEYAFNKNNVSQDETGYSVDDYLPMFVNFKLKVAEAKAQRLDTLTSFKEEYAKDRKTLAASYLTDDKFIEQEAYRVYAKDSAAVGADGIVKVVHIPVRLSQKAGDAAVAAAKARIDSVYNMLKSGASFEDAAASIGVTATSLHAAEIIRGQAYEEFENAVFSLADGCYSEPFRTPVAYHIVKRISSRPFGTFEEYKKPIMQMLEQQNIREAARLKRGADLAKEMGGNLTPEQALEREESMLEEKYPEFAMLMKEYYEGLLFFEISNREVWNNDDEKALAKFFKKNKKKYKFDSPRFRGAVVYTATQEIMERAKSLMGGKHPEEYRAIVSENFMNDSARLIRVEHGVYAIGDNKWIDKLAFGQGDGGRKRADLPFVDVVGQIIESPETYHDVKGAVMSDYNKYKEEKWVKRLRKKYKVAVDKEVLKTVNNH